MRLRAAVVAAAALLAGAAGAAAPFVVDGITATLAPGEHVGRVRPGLLCLPKSALAWRELGARGIDQRQIVAEALAEAELPASVARAGQPRHLRGTVTTAAFDLCARDWGRGRRDALSGRAALAMAWRVQSADGGMADLNHVSRIERSFAPAEADSAPALYRALLADAARELAVWLATRP